MKRNIPILTVAFVLGLSLFIRGRQPFVHNTMAEITACEGKVKLTLTRIWGDDEADDENHFFRFPTDIKIGKGGLVYIVDSGNHRVQVFDRAGNHKKSIGKAGRGPQDLLLPNTAAIDNNNNLVVGERGNHRIQFFDSEGRSLSSFKTVNAVASSIHITRKNEIAVHSHQKSVTSRSLITLYTTTGRIIRDIGHIEDNIKSRLDFEGIFCVSDKADNFFISYYATPYYRKYSYKGELVMIVTFDVPFEAPRVSREESQNEPKITGQKKGRVCTGLSADDKGRVFLVAATREQKKSERFFLVSDGPGAMRRVPKDIASENTDWFRLLVFSPAGKIVATQKLNVFCDGIYVHGNSLFIIDTYMGMKIYEYRISFAGH